MLTLRTKENMDETLTRWRHFWAGEVYKRPPVIIDIQKPGAGKPAGVNRHYYNACMKTYEDQLAYLDWWADNTLFLGESIPRFSPDHGPDQFAALLGAKLQFSKDSPSTNWVEPIVDDWASFIPDMKLDTSNETWQSLITYSRMLRERGKGKYIVGVCDLHSNGDTLSALRNPEKLCMDFYDYPELIAKAMKAVRAMYKPVYDGLYDAGGMADTGTSCWIPFYCEQRYATIQCDFICMTSPDIANEYIIPAIEEEANFLDHTIYHLDGPGALPHLDSLLAIKKLDAIQWVPGAGQPDQHEWLDVLKKVQKAGKGLQLWGNADVIKMYHRELKHEGVVYCPYGIKTREEADALLKWLEQN
ncbi:MAG: hypothetical protein HZC28_03210 [Spirochaetes bacterium]|nr:hypothetical protein [Spirochaetota bacterium]